MGCLISCNRWLNAHTHFLKFSVYNLWAETDDNYHIILYNIKLFKLQSSFMHPAVLFFIYEFTTRVLAYTRTHARTHTRTHFEPFLPLAFQDNWNLGYERETWLCLYVYIWNKTIYHHPKIVLHIYVYNYIMAKYIIYKTIIYVCV